MRAYRWTLRFIGWMIVSGSIAIGSPSAANAQSEELKQACTPDAMRLCGEFIPDRAKITRCMMSKRSQISSPCRAAMRAEGKHRHKRVVTHRRRGHHARHRHYE